jgi:hypothetical protein
MTQKARQRVLEALRNRALFGYLSPKEAEEAAQEALQDLPEGAREALELAALSLPIGSCCLLLIHLLQVSGFIPEDER